MPTLHFSIQINAPKQKVWDIMLADATYRAWTEPFHASSYYQGDWSEGSKMLFLGPNDDGTTSGMVSRIETNRLYEFISIEHRGEMQNGVEDTTSERVKKWAGAHENYTFTEKAGVTEVVVDLDMDIEGEFAEMFKNMWPKALNTLKEIVELKK